MKNYFSRILEDGWNVAVRCVKERNILNDLDTPFYVIPNTWRTWAADPFIFEDRGYIYVFAELFDYIDRKGYIGYTKLINGKWSKWNVAIKEKFHMSYPNIFRVKNDIYMIPETSADNTLRLYKAIEFPNIWKLDKKIIQGVEWVDTTFYTYENNIYAITTDISKEEHYDYRVKFDEEFEIVERKLIQEKCTSYSRPGGNFFKYENEQIRVSQDCLKSYGAGLIFSKFNPEKVCEEGLGEMKLHLFPNELRYSEKKSWLGLHTYNAVNNYEVVDVESKHFNVGGIISRFVSKLV